MLPYLAAISIYPVKSLDGIVLSQATLLSSGALQHDREYALFDDRGQVINGKRNAKVHLVRSTFDDSLERLSLQIQGTEQQVTFHLDEERTALEEWLSDFLGENVKLVQDAIAGFPDDTEARGPTAVSTGTLEEVASWFPQVSMAEMRSRFRTNLEIAGVLAFWEDGLFTEVGQCIRFQIGEVLFEGINPCQRCVVVTRDSKTAAATANFQKQFIAKRRESLPSWTTRSRFNHFFRLSVNTNVPASEAGKVLRLGDTVKILGIGKNPL